MAAAGMGPKDVVLAISNTGQTRALVEAVTLALDNGAQVVAITAPRSRLASLATATVAVEPCEDTETFTPMASRLNHLASVDLLTTGVLLARGPEIRQRLAAIKSILVETRFPDAG
ncbi:MAG: SIS domain-containing protein, partial [Myxococcota bacterium]